MLYSVLVVDVRDSDHSKHPFDDVCSRLRQRTRSVLPSLSTLQIRLPLLRHTEKNIYDFNTEFTLPVDAALIVASTSDSHRILYKAFFIFRSYQERGSSEGSGQASLCPPLA